MPPADPAPADSLEDARQAALARYRILDTLPEQAYDDIVRLAAQICDTPISLVTLLDEERQWFKAKVGLEREQTPREYAFCDYAVRMPGEVMVVPDASADARFAGNPLVTGVPGIRFYAGAPLVTPDGTALGALCVIDRQPRILAPAAREALQALARQVVHLLELRHALDQLQERQRQLETTRQRLDQVIEELAEQTLTDALTGLKNRRAFDRLLEEELARLGRSTEPLALILLDLDSFKSLNDEFGHVHGDAVLRQTAKLLASQARAYDQVVRYGGEEFALILPATHLGAAMRVAERIRRAVQDFPWARRALTVSLGVALARDAHTGQTLVERADQALYQAKQDGRNRVVQAQPL